MITITKPKRLWRSIGVLLMSTLAAASATTTSFAENDGGAYEFIASADGAYASVRILDTEVMPVTSPPNATGWGIKTLFENPAGGSLRILYVPPGAEGARVHYHEFHEWAYNIAGDFTNNESTTPDQVSGPLQRFREGNFLSRPPYSLHGGERGRQKFMASQIGAVILIMEESGVNAGTYTVDPASRSQTGGNSNPDDLGMKYNPNYKEIMHWSNPRIIDTLNEMPWQPVESSPGLNVKYLVDDPSHGYRATMWFLEAGAKTPELSKAHYYENAYQLNFVIAGDLKIQTYSSPGKKGESYTLGQHYFVERPPMSIVGLVAEGATTAGAVWLEVTYADKEAHWTDSPMPIEEPSYVE